MRLVYFFYCSVEHLCSCRKEGWIMEASKHRYTPLVEVNQAIFCLVVWTIYWETRSQFIRPTKDTKSRCSLNKLTKNYTIHRLGTSQLASAMIWGIARTQSPTNKNCALKWSTFETIVGVNQPEVQWDSLTLEEPPSWSWLTSAPGKYAG